MSSAKEPTQRRLFAKKQTAATNYGMLTATEVEELLRASQETSDYAFRAFGMKQAGPKNSRQPDGV